MKDKLGYAFTEGCKVARAVSRGRSSVDLDICTVTRIENGKIYLDDSKAAIKFPSRLLIIEQDPLYRMVKNYKNETS
jgi:hypothetical protein